jgi:putative MATE family efflux protein
MNEDLFDKMPIKRAVATLAIPTMLGMLVNIFYNMADTFFVGQTGDANQVAAVSLTTPIFLLLMAVGNIFGIGGSSVISRKLGEKDREAVKHVSSFCFYLSIVAGIIMMFFFIYGMPNILHLIGASANTYDYAAEYLAIIGYGSIFVIISTAFGTIIRSEGAAKVSMSGMILGTVTNIILDPILILTLDMDVAGAAIATIIGYIVTTVYYLAYFAKKQTILSISPRHWKPTGAIIGNIFAIGIPASLNNVLMSLSNVIMNNVLASYGDAAVAGMGIAQKVNMLVILLSIGLGTGIQPLIGYSYGSKNLKRMQETTGFAIKCSITFNTCVTILYLIFAPQIVRAFIQDEAVISIGVSMVRALMLAAPLIGVMFILSFSFQAMGKAVQSLILTLSRQGIVFLPILLISSKFFGLPGLIYSQPIADLASLVIAILMFISIKKKMSKEKTFQH